MSLSGVVGTIYSLKTKLEGEEVSKISDSIKVIERSIKVLNKNPWVSITDIKIDVSVTTMPDPNLNEDFWISVATGDYVVDDLRSTWIKVWWENFIG